MQPHWDSEMVRDWFRRTSRWGVNGRMGLLFFGSWVLVAVLRESGGERVAVQTLREA